MDDPPSVYEETIRVHWFDVGILGNLTLVALLNHLQEAAEGHAAELGVSLEFLRREKLLWVLSRYHVEVLRHARAGERIRIRTWPAGFQRLFAVREFEVLDSEDQVIALGSSAWLLLQEENVRPVRPKNVLPPIPVRNVRSIEEPFEPLPRLLPEKAVSSDQFKVRMHDLDINRHVNNTVYVRWALESVPDLVWDTHRPVGVEVNFQKMAYRGDEVQAHTVESDPPDAYPLRRVFLHGLYSARTGNELTRLRTVWEPFR